MGGENQSIPQAASISKLMGQYSSAFPGVFGTGYGTMNQYFPGMTGLPEQLAGIASQGMQGGVPDWARAQYTSDLNAQLGMPGSPIGADYVSRGLLQQGEDWNRYYQGLGLNVAGMAPSLYGAYSGGFNPGQVLGYGSSTYSPYLSAWQNQQNQTNPWISGGMGALGTIGGSVLGNMLLPGVGGVLGGALGGSLGGNLGSSFNNFSGTNWNNPSASSWA